MMIRVFVVCGLLVAFTQEAAIIPIGKTSDEVETAGKKKKWYSSKMSYS